MPPKSKSTGPHVYIVLDGGEIDSVHSTSIAASQRVVELNSDDAEVVKKELYGGGVHVNETAAAATTTADKKPSAKGAKTAKAAQVEEAEETEAAAAAPAAKPKPKTKTPAEQRAANAKKPAKGANEDLPDNVKALLASSGDTFAGMTIVVTGVPPMLGRKTAEALVESYGGHVSKSLSKSTAYVVVGNDAGPTKLEKIEQLGLKTLDEDALIALLESGAGGVKRAAAEEDDEEGEAEGEAKEKPAKAKKQKKK